MPSLIRVISLLLGLVAFTPALAFAADAEQALKTKHVELTALVKEDAKVKLDKAFDGILDYENLARDSLAEEWNARSAEERQEFQRLLTELVRNAYKRNIKRTLGYKIDYQGESAAAAGTLVKTVAHNTKNVREEPIRIDYTMHRVGSRWLVRDIITDGSSLVATYKNQFRRVVKKHGFADLLRRMRDKVAKGEAD